jgi:hypothetical protein
MAGELFKPVCAIEDANIGIPSCTPMIEVLQGAIFAQNLKAYAATSLSALVTALNADVINSVKSARLYPFFQFAELTADNTTEAPKITKGSGGVIFGSDKARDFRYEYNNVGLEAYKKFKKLSKSIKYMFGYDLANQLIGTKNAAGELLPIELQAFFVHEPKFNTDGTVNFFVDLITKDPYAFGSNAVIVDCSTTPLTSEMSGLFDVTIAATGTALKISITGSVDVTGEDFIEKYAGDVDVAGAWTVITSAGVTVTPSVVAVVAGSPYKVELTVTAATYNTVKLQTPTALIALSVGSIAGGGYESNIVSGVVVPAT